METKLPSLANWIATYERFMQVIKTPGATDMTDRDVWLPALDYYNDLKVGDVLDMSLELPFTNFSRGTYWNSVWILDIAVDGNIGKIKEKKLSSYGRMMNIRAGDKYEIKLATEDMTPFDNRRSPLVQQMNKQIFDGCRISSQHGMTKFYIDTMYGQGCIIFADNQEAQDFELAWVNDELLHEDKIFTFEVLENTTGDIKIHERE